MVKRAVSLLVTCSLGLALASPPQALANELLGLPEPGTMIGVTPAHTPVLIKGIKVYPKNPLLFDFILDSGTSRLPIGSPAFQAESQKLITYFLAALTIKEDDLWVNLSPYEGDRMIPGELGKTELGRDMLAQDYILKQLTASLIYPEKQLGQTFWNRVYAKARRQYGRDDIPVNTFNKVWIVADKAKVVERGTTAYVAGARLKVLLEEDYVALAQHAAVGKARPGGASHGISSRIVREVLVPEIEAEVNRGQNFAPLRQMFHAMVLASWYKIALKNALLNQVYSNREKTGGVRAPDPSAAEKIYARYLQAYKKGVFDYIKEDAAAGRPQAVARRYFSGGEHLGLRLGVNLEISRQGDVPPGDGDLAIARVAVQKQADAAMWVASRGDKTIVEGVGKLTTSEAVWVVGRLLTGDPEGGAGVLPSTAAQLQTAFGVELSELKRSITSNSTWRLGYSTWFPASRAQAVLKDTVQPKYDQLLRSEAARLTAFINAVADEEKASLLDRLLDDEAETPFNDRINGPGAEKLLAELALIIGGAAAGTAADASKGAVPTEMTEQMDLLRHFLDRLKQSKYWSSARAAVRLKVLDTTFATTILEHNWAGALRIISEGTSAGILTPDQAITRNARLWEGMRKEAMKGIDEPLLAEADAGRLEEYARGLVKAIEDGVLKDVDYLNFYLERGLLSRSNEKQYQAVVGAARTKGIVGDIVLNERRALYREAREVVVRNLNTERGGTRAAAVMVHLAPFNAPDLNDGERKALHGGAREVLALKLRNPAERVSAAAVLLGVRPENSGGMGEGELAELQLRALEVMAGALKGEGRERAAAVVLGLAPERFSGATKDRLMDLYGPAREAGKGAWWVISLQRRTMAAWALLQLTPANSPDLTNEQRLQLLKGARESLVTMLRQRTGGVAPLAALLGLTAENSPDMTDDDRKALLREARESAAAHFGQPDGDKLGAAGVLIRLNPGNSPDLSPDARKELLRQSREVARGYLGAFDYRSVAAARIILAPQSVLLDVVGDGVQRGADVGGDASSLNVWDDGPNSWQSAWGDTDRLYGNDFLNSNPVDSGSWDSGGANVGPDAGPDGGGDAAMRAGDGIKGGIDLNAAHMGLDVDRSAGGMRLDWDRAMAAEFKDGNFSGVKGVILGIVPLPGLLLPGGGPSLGEAPAGAAPSAAGRPSR